LPAQKTAMPQGTEKGPGWKKKENVDKKGVTLLLYIWTGASTGMPLGRKEKGGALPKSSKRTKGGQGGDRPKTLEPAGQKKLRPRTR